MKSLALRIGALLLACIVLQAVHVLLLRPWYTHWGATAAEAGAALPGDTLWPNPSLSETRAITVHARPDVVWPWVAQLGQDRAGFYSYELLENLIGAQMPHGTTLLGLPERKVGEKLWLSAPASYGGVGFIVVGLVEPGRVLAGFSHIIDPNRPVGAWNFVVLPDPEGTRFLIRGISGVTGQPQPIAEFAFDALVFRPLHFVMERRTLLGVKERAEGAIQPAWTYQAEPLAWLIIFALALVAAVGTLVRSNWLAPSALFACSGLALLLLPLLRPPLAVHLAVAVVLAAALTFALRSSRERGRPYPRPSFTRFRFQAGISTTTSVLPSGMHWQERRDCSVRPGASSSMSSSSSEDSLQVSSPCLTTTWQVEQAAKPPQACSRAMSLRSAQSRIEPGSPS